MSSPNPISDPAATKPVTAHRRPKGLLAMIVLIPTASVLAGITTLWIAGPGGLDVVSEPVQRIGRIQRADLSADAAAQAAHLRADASVVAGRLHLVLHGTTAQSLLLYLEHPFEAARDHQLVLVPDGRGGWTSDWPAEPVSWHLALGPADKSWRLVGRWPRSIDGATPLEPALAAP